MPGDQTHPWCVKGQHCRGIAVDCAGCLDPPQLWMHHEPGIKDGHPHQKKRGRQGKKTVTFLLTQEQARDELSTLLARKRHSQAKEKLLRTLMERSTLPWEDITGKMRIPATVIRDFEKMAGCGSTSSVPIEILCP